MRGFEEAIHLTHHPSLDRVSSMRYLVVLEALGRSWEGMMRAKGVKDSTVESWSIYYNQLTMQAATCKAEELRGVGHQIASSFKTAMWYMEKEGER